MANRDIILIIVVLLGISWLIFENYHRISTPAAPAKEQAAPAPTPTPTPNPAAK